MRYTVDNLYWQCLYAAALLSYLQFHHAGLCVDVLGLVEYKVADIIIYKVSVVFLYGLHGVCVMAYKNVSSCVNQPSGILPLVGGGVSLCSHPQCSDTMI